MPEVVDVSRQPVGDVLDARVRLLLVGVNPGAASARAGRHFAGPGNRFWAALAAAGLTPWVLGPAEQHRLPALGLGITNLVARPTDRATELARDELVRGAVHLRRLVRRQRPAAVAVLGLGAYRVAFARPRAGPGPQGADAWGVRWWLLANPSGLNAAWTVDDHAALLRAAGADAGLPVAAS